MYGKVSYILNTLRDSIRQDFIEIDQKMLENMAWDISVEQEFPKALAGGAFKVCYQPKYSVHTKEIVGGEALVRWVLPSGEVIPPNRFIPILENNGLINRLDEEIFCEMLK